MSEKMDKKHCVGCRDDFYNGKNQYGIQECWCLATAQLIKRKRVAMDERPPWIREPEVLPSCYRQKGYIFVKPEIEH